MQAIKQRAPALAYVVGRCFLAFTQVLVGVMATRYLMVSEVATFTVGLVFAMLSGTLGNPNLRRMVMDLWPGDDVSSFKMATLVMNTCILILAVFVAQVSYGRPAAIATGMIGFWRWADNYAEIGIGVWLHRNKQYYAGFNMLIRAFVTSAPTIYCFYHGRFEMGLLCGALSRAVCCTLETEIATGWRWSRAGLRTAYTVINAGKGYAGATIACMAFDVVPILILGKLITEHDLALLTPLGRIRLGLVMLGTISVDLAYSRLRDNRDNMTKLGKALYILLMRGLVFTALLCLFLVGGGAELVFGSLVANKSWELAAVCLAGYSTVAATACSSVLTALGRLRFQSLVYMVSTVLLSVIVCCMTMSLFQFYLLQTVLMLLSAIIFSLRVRSTLRR